MGFVAMWVGLTSLALIPFLSAANSPFVPVHLAQPVPGAQRARSPDGWRDGILCDVTEFGALGDNSTDSTAAIQRAIDHCGDTPGGGTVLLPTGGHFVSGSLWLRSNLTFRIESEASLIGSAQYSAYEMTYTRSGCVMMHAHAALLNGGRCTRMKSPLVGWDDCAEWYKLSNLVIEGGGSINGNGDHWGELCTPTCPDDTDASQRPTLLGLLWVNGLTIRGLTLVHSAFWTVHPTFSNNVRVEGNIITQTGHGTDGIDPDSSWNIYIANNVLTTRDDDIALKAGKDWSGRMVNISTENVLIVGNYLTSGHGIAIGSETSGWIRNVTIRDHHMEGVETVVRIKSMRGRGGGVESILYQNISGYVEQPIQINLGYHKAKPTNASATPVVRDVVLKDIYVHASESAVLCDGLIESHIQNLTIQNLTIQNQSSQECNFCDVRQQYEANPPVCVNTTVSAVTY